MHHLCWVTASGAQPLDVAGAAGQWWRLRHSPLRQMLPCLAASAAARRRRRRPTAPHVQEVESSIWSYLQLHGKEYLEMMEKGPVRAIPVRREPAGQDVRAARGNQLDSGRCVALSEIRSTMPFLLIHDQKGSKTNVGG